MTHYILFLLFQMADATNCYKNQNLMPQYYMISSKSSQWLNHHHWKCKVVKELWGILKKPFPILNLNLWSIKRNFNSLSAFVIRSRVDWDIIILTECCLLQSSVLPTLKGYKTSATISNNNQNDEVVVYFREHCTLTVTELMFWEFVLKLPIRYDSLSKNLTIVDLSCIENCTGSNIATELLIY